MCVCQFRHIGKSIYTLYNIYFQLSRQIKIFLLNATFILDVWYYICRKGDFMKKKIIITLIVALIIALLSGAMYLIDMNRIDNNKPVVFSTWGYDYAPPVGDVIKTDEYHTFVGTVLEETTTYMIVEPNEDEVERKLSDRIVINYGTDHIDYLYGIGRKVIISYTGYIMETYPAQINTDEIAINGYDNFEILIEKADKIDKKKVLNNSDLYKNNSGYDLYYYGLDEVNVRVDNKNMSLEEALESGKLTLDGIIAKANQDLDNKIIEGDMYKDGGSMIYKYDTYTIIKFHTLDGNRDIWIGIPEMTMNNINY